MGDEQQYRIVFRGEMAYGFEQDETRANLKRLCKYDEATLDRLFSGKPVVLKSKLSRDMAGKYKQALDRTGAVCVIEEVPAEAPKPAPVEKPQTMTCPKCGREQSPGMTCVDCGIVFAKYHEMQRRKVARERGEIPDVPPPDSPETELESGLWARLGAYLDRHQEQAFILKAFLVIAGILFLTKYFSGLIALFVLLFPVLFLIYVRFDAAATGRSASEVLAQHITFMPVMYTEGERKKEGVTWVTYSLILINVLIFYGFELQVSGEVILDYLIFIPLKPDVVSLPVSLISSMFLHASGGHLWGNMLFLWTIGTVVERRIGGRRFLAFYLLAGVAASLLAAAVHFLFFHSAVRGLGASGAIAGAMGLFAVRCYFKSMVFPLPILGIFSLILPVSLKVRLNSLVIIGLFFLVDLSGGIGQVTGQSDSHIGHWAHIGGMVCGIVLGLMFKLGEEAVEERHQDIGSQALSRGGDLFKGEESLRLALQRNPDNADTVILLARMVSKFQPTEEGEQLYRKGMDILSRTRLKEVTPIFKEYYQRYLKAADYETMFRLAACYRQLKDDEWASRCLELLAYDPKTPATMRERAMFQCACQMEALGKFDIALHYYRQFVETFPQSPMHAKALARLNAA